MKKAFVYILLLISFLSTNTYGDKVKFKNAPDGISIAVTYEETDNRAKDVTVYLKLWQLGLNPQLHTVYITFKYTKIYELDGHDVKVASFRANVYNQVSGIHQAIDFEIHLSGRVVSLGKQYEIINKRKLKSTINPD